jgi:hypothetical protein
MWALVIDGEVREVTDIDPQGRFHSSLVWVACDESVEPGYLYDGQSFYSIQKTE